MADFQFSPMLKHALWFGFMSTMALSMVPLINMVSMPIIYDALFATGFTVAGLALVAYNAPSEQFLYCMSLAAMFGVGIASMFWPNSPGLFNFWVYGGLLLFSAFVLYDT